jgi:hypothetical protein
LVRVGQLQDVVQVDSDLVSHVLDSDKWVNDLTSFDTLGRVPSLEIKRLVIPGNRIIFKSISSALLQDDRDVASIGVVRVILHVVVFSIKFNSKSIEDSFVTKTWSSSTELVRVIWLNDEGNTFRTAVIGVLLVGNDLGAWSVGAGLVGDGVIESVSRDCAISSHVVSGLSESDLGTSRIQQVEHELDFEAFGNVDWGFVPDSTSLVLFATSQSEVV